VAARSAQGPRAATSLDGGQLIASVERGLDVLLLFANSERPDLGVTEIARDLGISKAVVHRLLMTLASRRLIDADPATRRYRLGSAALTLGAAYLDRIDLTAQIAPHLRDLSNATQETAIMSVRSDWLCIHVMQVIPERDVRMEVAIGRPSPLHAGSSSMAFLAHLPDAERERYLAQPELAASIEGTVVDTRTLRADLEAIRYRGYAVSLGQGETGAACIAAPVLDRHGEPVAVISVCGPTERFGPRIEAVTPPLLAATRAVSRALGG
jgi:DNA-binding IclR family transcriptional regulator